MSKNRIEGKKVCLINPKGTLFSNNPDMNTFLTNTTSMDSFRHFWSAPCLGLLTIAAYIPEYWDITYIDENFKSIDFDDDFDIVFISAMTVQAQRAYEIADMFRDKFILTVIGGIHATVEPDEAMLHADIVIAGEGEVLFPEFINDFQQNKLRSLYIDDNPGKYDLSECITPRYDLISEYDYPVINIYTTRGCPFKCDFCCASNVYGHKYRRKTNKQIMEEIDYIVKLYPNKMLLFADDNLFVLRNQSKELLRSLINKNIRYIAQTDISIADDEDLLRLMYESGCQWIVIGFESVSEENLKDIKNNLKYKSFQAYSEKIKKIQSYGIKIYGTFIVGLDNDKDDIFEKTAEFIINNDFYGANITVPTPLPGTSLRKNMLSQERIFNNNWKDYTLWDVVIEPKQMSVSQLERGLLYTYKKISENNSVNARLINLFRNIKNMGKGR